MKTTIQIYVLLIVKNKYKLRKINSKLTKYIQVYLYENSKGKQALINESLQRITMNSGHILVILIGFYASFAVTVMSVTPFLG